LAKVSDPPRAAKIEIEFTGQNAGLEVFGITKVDPYQRDKTTDWLEVTTFDSPKI